MAPIGTLYTTPGQGKGKIIRAIATLGGAEITLAPFEMGVTNKSPEFLAKFPLGKIPAFEGPNGFKLFEGDAIARYVAGLAPNSNLLGSTAEETALINQWIHAAETEVDTYDTWVRYLCRGMIPYNKAAETAFYERIERGLNTLEAHISTRTFFVTERITLADLAIAAYLLKAVSSTVDAQRRTKYPNLIRHLETVINQPALKDIYGPAEYTEKQIAFVPPAKEKKEKAPAPPKAEKKPKKEEVEEEEADVPAEPKAKNPLDDLPKSTFNLEDWKRAYSNKDTRGPDGAIEWFYQNYDPAGFSVWRVDFKYNSELTLTFMSSNQITGFFNRLEASRKYLFASVGVLGESNNSVIAGTLIARGTDIEPVVNVAPDWESYEYKKLDLSNEADKAFFEAALAWDLEIDGKKWVDGKNPFNSLNPSILHIRNPKSWSPTSSLRLVSFFVLGLMGVAALPTYLRAAPKHISDTDALRMKNVRRDDSGSRCSVLSLDDAKKMPGFSKIEQYATDTWGDGSRNIVVNPEDFPDAPANACVDSTPTKLDISGEPQCTTQTNSAKIISTNADGTETHFMNYSQRNLHAESSFSTGASFTVGLEVPELFQASATYEFSTSVTNSQGKTFETTTNNQQTTESTINNKADSNCTNSLQVTTCKQNGSGKLRVAGTGFVWFNFDDAVATIGGDPKDKHFKWAVSIDEVLSLDERSSFIEISGFMSSDTNADGTKSCQ
ncbi:hypothetical protein NP233_g8884 [Leucocoprinus birnbaumii]|uniref:Elongation factor 1-gamma n=1 Tax=Leucocoprinus birnbaumii TaxID=56174 RepID=A0AAD5VN64_9AGAR|nr:hypothetical protein NP233_g8884 [Leucocoprinus birnbaumii]